MVKRLDSPYLQGVFPNPAAAMAATVGGLGPSGELVAVGVTPENLPVSPLQLINAGCR